MSDIFYLSLKWQEETNYKRQIFGLPGSSAGKESACNAGDPGSIPGLGRSARKGIGYLLQYSWASLMAQLVKNPPAMQETWVQQSRSMKNICSNAISQNTREPLSGPYLLLLSILLPLLETSPCMCTVHAVGR